LEPNFAAAGMVYRLHHFTEAVHGGFTG